VRGDERRRGVRGLGHKRSGCECVCVCVSLCVLAGMCVCARMSAMQAGCLALLFCLFHSQCNECVSRPLIHDSSDTSSSSDHTLCDEQLQERRVISHHTGPTLDDILLQVWVHNQNPLTPKPHRCSGLLNLLYQNASCKFSMATAAHFLVLAPFQEQSHSLNPNLTKT
jgi:hypothetical protein